MTEQITVSAAQQPQVADNLYDMLAGKMDLFLRLVRITITFLYVSARRLHLGQRVAWVGQGRGSERYGRPRR